MVASRCLERRHAAKTTAAPHFVWIKGLCHKITDLSEQERGRDPCRGRSILDSRLQILQTRSTTRMLLKDPAVLKQLNYRPESDR